MLMNESENIVLQSVTVEDLPKLFEWINNRLLVELNGPFREVDWESHQKWFAKISQDRTALLFGIRLKTNGKLIGTCQLHSINPLFQSAELQIRIGETIEHSKGYGSEAVFKLIKYGFEELGLHRIYLYVYSDNLRAIKTYLKNGFVKEGLLREACLINKERKDLVVMAILQSEFEQQVRKMKSK